MTKVIFSRFLQALPTLWVIATVTFFMTRFAPGGPFDSEKAIPEEIKIKLQSHFGLDRPLFDQYLLYLKNLLQGDLGPSFKYPEWNVSELIATAFPVSLTLGALSLTIALLLGIPVGMIAALKRNTWMDYLPMSLTMAGICLPTFVLGPFLIYGLSTQLGLFPHLAGTVHPIGFCPLLLLGFFMQLTLHGLPELACSKLCSRNISKQLKPKGLHLGVFLLNMLHEGDFYQ